MKARTESLITQEEARKRLGIGLDRLVLLNFGAPHPGKSLLTVWEAVSKAKKDLPQILILSAGTHVYSLGNSPEWLTQEFKVKDNILTFNRFITEEEKPYFFAAADAVMLSYTKAFASTSSMLWEAAKYDRPVISSDANLLGEEVVKYGLGATFEAENSEDLVQAIKMFAGIYKITDNWRKGREKFLDDYSQDKWAARYRETITKLQTVPGGK